jgi:hypothetical protein
MILTDAIIKEASKYIGCKEERSNRGVCVDAILSLYSEKLTADA